jgi:membrane protein YdbS with pleckstrin-like domain
MPLPRKLLNEDEELLAEMRPHWVYIFGPLVTSILVWAAVGALIIIIPNTHGWDWTSYPLLVIAAIPSLWLLGRVVRWRSYILALTNTRIIVRHGVISRDTVQLRLQRITEINLAQLLWERMLGTGRLVIDVQGEDDSMILEYVRKPAIVQRVINAQINQLVGGGAAEPIPAELRPAPHADDTPPQGTGTVPSDPDRASGATHGDVATRLIELDDLRQRGILSAEEFAAKKAELLDRI